MAWSARDDKAIRRTFKTIGEAKAWRQDTQVALRQGTIRAPATTTVAEAAEAWLAAAQAGVVRTRSGDRYKPSALRSYEQALRARVIPRLGDLRISSVRRSTVQDFADALVAEGLGASSVRNAVLPLRAIFRRAAQREEVAINPTLNLTLPAYRGRRERVAQPAEAVELLAALAPTDRALWATALYAGLRRGELRGLLWSDVELTERVIRITRSWDRIVGPVAPKSRSGTRTIPLTDILRTYLLEHRLRQSHGANGHVFPNTTATQPFDPSATIARARAAWAHHGLKPIGLHECRHTYASFMIAAGVNAKALSTYMGHASITITLDRYGHLLPGNEHHAATLLNTYLTTEPTHPANATTDLRS